MTTTINQLLPMNDIVLKERVIILERPRDKNGKLYKNRLPVQRCEFIPLRFNRKKIRFVKVKMAGQCRSFIYLKDEDFYEYSLWDLDGHPAYGWSLIGDNPNIIVPTRLKLVPYKDSLILKENSVVQKSGSIFYTKLISINNYGRK